MDLLSYQKRTIRSSAILTGSYVAGTVLGPTGQGTLGDPVENNQLILLVSFTIGSLTSAEIKVEFSDDNTTFYQETSEAVASGVATASLASHTFTATGNYRIPISIGDRYIKVSTKGTGTVTSSLMAIDGVLAIR